MSSLNWCGQGITIFFIRQFINNFFLLSRWHLLSHSEGGFTARAAHSAVYLKETDSLYVFGGFDLNNVLGDLVVYQFKLSQWEDESGKQIGKCLPICYTYLLGGCPIIIVF